MGLLQWRVLERSALRGSIVDRLDAPGAVVVLEGESGVGKSTLAQLAAASHPSTVTAHIVAMRELSEIPLGALAPLAASAAQSVGRTADRYQAHLDAVTALAPNGVLIVDDAPHLDDLSAALVYQAVRIAGLRIILTARTGLALPAPLARLHHEGVARNVIVPPLTVEEVEQLIALVLDSEPDPGTVARLTALSGGNPLVLRELLEVSAERGEITSTAAGVRVSSPDLPMSLDELVHTRMTTVSSAAATLAATLTVAGPVPTPRLAGEPVKELLRAGLARADAGTIAIAHDGFRVAILDRLEPGDLQARERDAQELLRGDATDDALAPLRALRRARLARRTGAALTAEELVEAARAALSSHDDVLALGLARDAVAASGTASGSADATVDAELVCAAAASRMGDDDAAEASYRRAREAATLVDETPGRPSDAQSQVVRVVSTHAHHLAIRRGAPSEAVALIESVEGSGAAVLRAEGVKWRSMAGEALAPPPMPEFGVGEAGTLGIMLVQAMVQTMGGQLTVAGETIESARPVAVRLADQMPFAADLLDLDEYLVMVFSGNIAEAGAFADERIDPERPETLGLWTYVLALQHAQTGRWREAARLAARSVRALRWVDFTGLVGAADALWATTLVRTGEPRRAEAVLAEISPERFTDIKVVLQAAEARAWLLWERGRTADAARVLTEAADLGIRMGHPTLAALAAFAAILQGSASRVVEILERAASLTDAALLALYRDHAVAAVARDANALVRIGEQHERADNIAGAANAWMLAGEILDAEGRRDSARTLRARLAALPEVEGLVGVAGTGVRLTAREREVAEAAASRERSREIAARLGVSVRTVEHQLGSVYRKLGISSRDELRERLSL